MVARWKYRRHQAGQMRASFYYFGQYGVALPHSGSTIYWPVDRPITLQVVPLDDFEEVGRRILAELQRKDLSRKDGLDPSRYPEAEADFRAGMEEFRACLGVGKRRFEAELDLIGIHHDAAGVLTLTKQVQARGRFAFEGAGREDYVRTLNAGYTAVEIGEAIVSLSETT